VAVSGLFERTLGVERPASWGLNYFQRQDLWQGPPAESLGLMGDQVFTLFLMK